MGNRGGSVQDRASNLQNRMADRTNMGDRQQQRQENRGERQSQRQDSRGDRQQNRQDYRNQAREDWQNWANDYHGGWYGAWGGGWYPGAGWGYMWDNYPVAAALGVTWWGASRLAYAFGMGGYSNPYYESGGGGYDYSEPVVVYEDQPAVVQQASADASASAAEGSAQALPPGVTQAGLDEFEKSRSAFKSANYQQALELVNSVLKQLPNDAVVHEFRSLVLFALKNYRESAAAAYAVLTAGPGWDWPTLSSLYGSAADYTTQLRALEDYVLKNPKSSDAHFLLAYHYLTIGQPAAAKRQLQEVDEIMPNDRLVRQLLGLSTEATQPPPSNPTPQPPIDEDKLLKAEQLVGAWTAKGKPGEVFQLTLNKDKSYVWKFTSGKKSDELKGVFGVEQNNLALEVSDGGVLLAEVELNGNQLKFKIIGGDPDTPTLNFTKGK
jgi:hypothetical protein